jgi:hypothetical protein
MYNLNILFDVFSLDGLNNKNRKIIIKLAHFSYRNNIQTFR